MRRDPNYSPLHHHIFLVKLFTIISFPDRWWRWQRRSSIPSSPILLRASLTQGCSRQRPRQTDPMQRQKRQKRQRRNVGPHSHNRPGKSQHHAKKKYLPHQLTFYQHSCPFISFFTNQKMDSERK